MQKQNSTVFKKLERITKESEMLTKSWQAKNLKVFYAYKFDW